VQQKSKKGLTRTAPNPQKIPRNQQYQANKNPGIQVNSCLPGLSRVATQHVREAAKSGKWRIANITAVFQQCYSAPPRKRKKPTKPAISSYVT
jgi:hypothetical protein